MSGDGVIDLDEFQIVMELASAVTGRWVRGRGEGEG